MLTFTRQVTEAEAGARKARVAANSLALNGGAIGADGLAAELGFAVAPYVSNVERVPDDSGDGRWTDGEAIRIRLSFNAPVTVNTANGIPSIRFRTGENARTAPYAQGSGTAVLVFAYPVAGADGTISSVAVSSGSIALNGGAIADAATGMAAELAHEGVGLSVPPPEVLPTLSVADAQTQEGQDATLDFAVTLSPAASDTVTVTWATADGTATAGADYTAADGTLTFAAGETAMTVTVTVLDDAVDEGEETLTLTLSDASGAVLADADATGHHRELLRPAAQGVAGPVRADGSGSGGGSGGRPAARGRGNPLHPGGIPRGVRDFGPGAGGVGSGAEAAAVGGGVATPRVRA